MFGAALGKTTYDILRSDKNFTFGFGNRRYFNESSDGNDSVGVDNFDKAREKAFDEAGLTNPDDIEISKVDPETGTATEFKGPRGAKVGYDGPHESPGEYHDKQHISWQSGGKRSNGGRRGNIPYNGPQHPSR